MKKPLYVENNITIDAPAAQVWDMLTNPEQTKKYMFGCETVSDWKKGSALLWRALYEGKEIVYVEGHIKDIIPGKFLEYTTVDSSATIIDKPENHVSVTYSLTEMNGKTTLVVTQGDYAKVEESERRYKEAVNNGEGWNPVLQEIKRLVEMG